MGRYGLVVVYFVVVQYSLCVVLVFVVFQYGILVDYEFWVIVNQFKVGYLEWVVYVVYFFEMMDIFGSQYKFWFYFFIYSFY